MTGVFVADCLIAMGMLAAESVDSIVGVRCVAAELVEEYCERAAERCQQEILDLGGVA